jgi:hypothetical protein
LWRDLHPCIPVTVVKSLTYGRFKRTVFRMAERLDISLVERQRCAIEFCVRLGKSGSGIKRLGREADHSPPSSAGVIECVELYLHSPIRLHGVVLS